MVDKWDDLDGAENNSGAGQILRGLSRKPWAARGLWDFLLLEYDGPIPEPMLLIGIPEGEAFVFERDLFNFENENAVAEYNLICFAWPEFSLIFSLNWLKVCGAQWDNTVRKLSKNLRNKHVIAK